VSTHPAVRAFAGERRTVSCGKRTIDVLCSRQIVHGQDVGVVLMHEAFGVTESVLRLAGRIAEAGFVVWVPVLFGPSHKPATRLTRGTACLYSWCVRREICAFAANRTSPITEFILAACQTLGGETGLPVGVNGLRLSGNFALATTTESVVNAVVCGQPSFPFLGKPSTLQLGDGRVEALKRRASAGLDIFAVRFDEDGLSPKERLDRLRDLVGPTGVDAQEF